jgi:hypothetical protein
MDRNLEYYKTTMQNPLGRILFPILVLTMMGSIVFQMIRNRTPLSLVGFILALSGSGISHMFRQQFEMDISKIKSAKDDQRALRLLDLIAKCHVALLVIMVLGFIVLQLDLLLLEPKFIIDKDKKRK